MPTTDFENTRGHTHKDLDIHKIYLNTPIAFIVL